MAHNEAFLKLVDEARKHIKECTIEDVHDRRAAGEEFHLIDIREDNEVARGKASGAVHIGRGVLERDIESRIPERDAPIVLYCGGGFRSALAAESLQKMGYTNVISMDGGFRAWAEAGYEIDR